MDPSRIEKGKEKITMGSNSDDGDESWEWENIGNIPIGYKFEAEDEQLITYYLKPKLEHKELPPNFIHEIDLYRPGFAELNPESLAAKYEGYGKKCYFFTPRDRKYPNGRRPSRASGTGYWKATAACKHIRRSTGNKELLGHKSSLVFYQGSPPGRKTNWLMQEFSVAEHLVGKTATPAIENLDTSRPQKRIKLDEWVLCIIYQNGKNENKQKKIREANFSINKGERPEPAVEGCVDPQVENHNGVSEDDHNKNEVHESGGSNASTAEQVKNCCSHSPSGNIGYNNNMASPNYWMMEWSLPTPSEDLVSKHNYRTNDDGNENMPTSIGDTADDTVQGTSYEGAHNSVQVMKQRGDNEAMQVVQQHRCIGKANVTVDDNFLFDDYLFETFDFSSEDSLEWLQDLMNS